MSRVNYFVRFDDNYLGRLRVLLNLVTFVVSFRRCPAPMGAGQRRGKILGSATASGISIFGRHTLPDDNYFSAGGGSASLSAGLSLRFFRRKLSRSISSIVA